MLIKFSLKVAMLSLCLSSSAMSCGIIFNRPTEAEQNKYEKFIQASLVWVDDNTYKWGARRLLHTVAKTPAHKYRWESIQLLWLGNESDIDFLFQQFRSITNNRDDPYYYPAIQELLINKLTFSGHTLDEKKLWIDKIKFPDMPEMMPNVKKRIYQKKNYETIFFDRENEITILNNIPHIIKDTRYKYYIDMLTLFSDFPDERVSKRFKIQLDAIVNNDAHPQCVETCRMLLDRSFNKDSIAQAVDQLFHTARNPKHPQCVDVCALLWHTSHKQNAIQADQLRSLKKDDTHPRYAEVCRKVWICYSMYRDTRDYAYSQLVRIAQDTAHPQCLVACNVLGDGSTTPPKVT